MKGSNPREGTIHRWSDSPEMGNPQLALANKMFKLKIFKELD
jgi:hypothetical protein